MVWSSSYEETLALAEFYLAHEAERENIAKTGQQYVYENHTYEKRVCEIMKALP
ncbi:MAG: glycosyltransferase [Clostridia bacterium]|nr:glycosyltransferase [Clostridia bacterium]